VNRLFLGHVLRVFQVRNLQRSHRLDGRGERFIDVFAASLLSEVFSGRPKGPKDLGPVEALTGTMFTEAHGCLSFIR
jgi:hypothetical protein